MEKLPISREVEEKEKKEKPVVVYHGSSTPDLEELQPRKERVRDEKEGRVVFGTADRAFASMFLGPRPDDSWSSKGSLNGVYYILIGDEKRYRREDKGGVIYEMPGEAFEHDPSRGMETEWVAKKSITPKNKQQYPFALDAMIENGVQVYFVDERTLNEFKESVEHSPDHGQSILENLESENQRRGVNIKDFKPQDKTK